MKFGRWTYKLDALTIIGNKTSQLVQKQITGQENDGFSEDQFEENGVIILNNDNTFLCLCHDLKYLLMLLLGMGNTRSSRKQDRNYISVQ